MDYTKYCSHDNFEVFCPYCPEDAGKDYYKGGQEKTFAEQIGEASKNFEERLIKLEAAVKLLNKELGLK